MASNHFACVTFGCKEQEDLVEVVYRAADVDNPDLWPPRCEGCAQPMEKRPQPGDFALDLKTDGDGDRGFQKFVVHRQVPTAEGLKQVPEVIDSLHKLRQVEKDSEQRYRDGEGEPLRFRAYANEHSNMDVGSFGDQGEIGGRRYSNGQAPAKKRNIGVARHGQQKPQVAVARGAGRSALPTK